MLIFENVFCVIVLHFVNAQAENCADWNRLQFVLRLRSSHLHYRKPLRLFTSSLPYR